MSELRYTSRRGFTLIELLVYIMLVSVVVLIAGRIYVDSVRFRIATLDKLKSFSGVNEMSNVLQEDLFRIGLKGYMQDGSSALINPNIYWNSEKQDFSSFHHVQGGAFDELQFKLALYDGAGKINDSLRVHYWVENRTLWRNEYNHESNNIVNETQAMLAGVDSFKVELGEYLADSVDATSSFDYETTQLTLTQVDGSGNLVIADSAIGRSIRGMVAQQLSEVAVGSGFVMEPGVPYAMELEIGFNDPVFLNFNPTSEYLSFTLREWSIPPHTTVPGIADVPYYPGGVRDVYTRHGSFTLPGDANKTMVPILRFLCDGSCSDPDARVYVRRVRIWKQATDQYQWWPTLSSDPSVAPDDIAKKKRVKALRVTIVLNKNGEITRVRKVIPTPNNGV